MSVYRKIHPTRTRLTKEQREEVKKALRSGEKGTEIAERYSITRQAISLIKRSLDADDGDPNAIAVYNRRKSPLRMRLEPEMWEELASIVKSTSPTKHRLAKKDDYEADVWNLERVTKLAEKLYGRKPAFTRVTLFLDEHFPKKTLPQPGRQRPKPPVRVTMGSISPEFRDNDSFVKYVTSETYWKIQKRSYKVELAEYEKYKANLVDPNDDSEDFDEADLPPALPPVKSVRKRRKGPAFTKAKKRKKK